MPLPSFLIIGVQRGGTTALTGMLRSHDDVWMARVKELHYFDAHYERGIEWYERQFAGGEGAAAIGEATPRYMYVPEAMDRIAATVPTARLIAILRHPVDRAFSHYRMERSRGTERLDFEDAIEAEPQRMAAGEERLLYLDRSRYGRQLEHVGRHFPHDQVLVLLNEELRHDQQATLHRVWRLLGVPDRSRSAALRSAAKDRIGSLRKRRDRGRRGDHAADQARMNDETRERLVALMEPEIVAVEEWLGRPLPDWRR